MTSFLDLPNELIVAIASFLQKPYEILQLILSNRHIHQTCQHLLYKYITLDFRAAYRSSPKSVLTNYHSRQVGQGYPHGAITRLSLLLSQPGVHLGSDVHALDLTLELNAKCPEFGLRALLPHLHNLRHFRLSIEKALNLDGKSQITRLSARSLGADLDPVSKTLKSLCICADHGRTHRDGSSIGDLRHLTSLQSLSIQSHILFGDKKNNSLRSLHQILPLSIQELLFDCLSEEIRGPWRDLLSVSVKRAEPIRSMLESHLMRSPGALQDLRNITLLLEYEYSHSSRTASLFKRWDNVYAKVLERGIRLELKTFRRQELLTTKSSPFPSERRPYYLETPLTRS